MDDACRDRKRLSRFQVKGLSIGKIYFQLAFQD
jgi:hypothetical protein